MHGPETSRFAPQPRRNRDATFAAPGALQPKKQGNRMIARLLAPALVAALFATPALAQDASKDPPKRIRSVILYGEEACPKPENPDEIVVCASAGESQYRIPKRFREEAADRPDARSWSRKVEMIEDVNRVGMPGSCSPVGIGGQFGCSREFIRQWAQERLEKKAKEDSER
jgi:hypothetical protein